MAPKRFGPPTQAKDRRAGVLLRFGDLDYPDNIEKTFRAQSNRRAWPRKLACATREPGPGELAVHAALEQERKKSSLQYTSLRPPGPGDPTAQRTFKLSADELLDGLLTGYKHAVQNFRANPTPDRWRTLYRARTLWRVAYMSECQTGRGNQVTSQKEYRR